MAPVEEQEEEGTVGGGGLLPRYAVGSEVEVQIADRGFHGAYYEAIVTARLPDSGGYEVVYSTLVEDGGGGPLREAVAPVNVRPRPSPLPPPGAARCDLNVFDMVEAYHNEGWWPGVVSGAWPASTVMEPRYAVSLPTREVVEVVASLVRPRRVFVRGRWMDMQEVSGFHARTGWSFDHLPVLVRMVPRVPLYDEGSNVEVICPQGKQGMMTATVIKMVDSANYVVQHGDSKRSILVLHSRYIRPPPDFDRLKFQYTLEPSAEVEVYQDGTWLPGVISEIGSCESSKYAVRVKKHNNADEDDYTLVSSAFLRPCCKWDGQQWRLSSTKASYQLHKKHARKRKYTLSIENSLSPVFSTPGGDSDQNSFVRNKRMRTDNVRNEGLHMRHSLHPNEVTTGSSSKGDIDMEAPADKHTTMMEKLDNEIEAKGKECMPASNIVLNMSCKHGDRKKRNCLTKAFANTRGNNKSSYLDVVEISDSSGYSDGIEIDDSSSCNPSRRRKRRKSSIDTGDGLNCRIVQLHQESLPNSAQNTPSNQCVLLALGLEEASHVPSNTEGVPLTPLSCYPDLRMQPLQVLPTLNERKELPLSDHVCSEAEPVAPYDSTARDGIQEMCQEVTEAKILLADDCDEVPDTFLLTSESSKQSVGDPIHGKASSMRQRSRNSEVSISLKIGSSSSAEQFLPSEDMEVPERCKKTHDVMGMVNNIAGICLKEKDNFMNCMPCPNSEGSSSLAHPGRILVHPAMTMDLSAFMPAPNSNGLPPELVTSSLLLGLLNKMEVFTRLPQNLHFSKLLQDSHPELREGKAIGLVISFSHLAESIQNMRIQDEEKKIQQKMSSLAELEENGFEVGALKERLENLLRIKSRQMDFKGKKAILEQAILEKEGAYNTVEQKVGILDIGIKELERMLLHAQEEKASLVEQKSAIGLEISKLQGDACRAEELYMSTESDFGRTATAPWEACLPADNTCL